MSSPTPIRSGGGAFGPLPLELFLLILDQLVGIPATSPKGTPYPLALPPSSTTIKTLRSLTLVSRAAYLLTTPYLYKHGLDLHTATALALFRRTFSLPLNPSHPQSLAYGEAGLNTALFTAARVRETHITSAFISPMKERTCETLRTPMTRLPWILDLGATIGETLTRLAIDTSPIFAPTSEIVSARPYTPDHNIFLRMPRLRELICSFDIVDYFPVPPPSLKRLAITSQGLDGDALSGFVFSRPSLETLICIRDPDLSAQDVEDMFTRYKGASLDVMLVDVRYNHATPEGCRDWDDEHDKVRVWEVDVPCDSHTSIPGTIDDGTDKETDHLVLCDGWIWSEGVKGTIWNASRHRMWKWSKFEASRADI